MQLHTCIAKIEQSTSSRGYQLYSIKEMLYIHIYLKSSHIIHLLIVFKKMHIYIYI